MTFFVGTIPSGADREIVADRFNTYMLAKKHQVRSDRSMGLLVNHHGRIVSTAYMNNPAGDDDELDALGEAIGLRRTWESPKRTHPVSKKKRKRAKRRRRS